MRSATKLFKNLSKSVVQLKTVKPVSSLNFGYIKTRQFSTSTTDSSNLFLNNNNQFQNFTFPTKQ
nr:hypothetical protein [Dictyostelium discoideum]